MQGHGKRIVALGTTLLAGLGLGVGVSQRAQGGVPVTAAAYIADQEPIVRAVQLAAPSVVSIDTTTRQSQMVFDSTEDWLTGRGRREVREVPTGSGSGVLLDDGYVLTNQHVVGNALATGGRVQVTLSDGRSVTARPVGADRMTDVALLQVQGAGRLPAAVLGDKSVLMPGQTVIAIGNPVGLSSSVSAGVVSAVGRPLVLEERVYENLIQTDTAINPGNSGGALVDLAGHVVGINTLVRADAQNIGFAIPIQTALRIVNELKRYGKVRRAFDGIVPMELTGRLAQRLGVPDGTRGVVVRAVYRSSPAAGAGLEQGDVIVQFAGEPVGSVADYRRILGNQRIGQSVEVMVWREGARKTATLRLDEAP